jgi:hypothetical protein
MDITPTTTRHEASPATEPASVSKIAGTRIGWHFWRHFLEMNAAMFIGMGIGALLFGWVLSGFGTTPKEARLAFPEVTVLVMGFNMTLPMVAWMRHRGHGWRSSSEMAAMMLLLAVPLCVLLRMQAISFGSVCFSYCGLMVPAMFALMLYRRTEYQHPQAIRVRPE